MLGLLVFTLSSCSLTLPAQQPSPATGFAAATDVPAKRWIQAAAANEVRIIQNTGNLPVRYSVHKVDAKGDVVREVIETSSGSVARLVKKNGELLSASEDAAERDRLKEIVDSPDEFAKHHRRDESVRDYSVSLVRLMPDAMVYTYVPGQPQPGDAARRQIVIDFKPDPAFHPPTMMSELLTGLAGRMWIDAGSQRLTRVEGHVLRPVNFGWGIVARIYPGGTIEFEQESVGENGWVYSEVNEHLKIRAMMVKTEEENTQMRAYNFHLLPAPMSVGEAVGSLLAMKIAVR